MSCGEISEVPKGRSSNDATVVAFRTYFLEGFIPNLEDMSQFDLRIFSDGLVKNHQLDDHVKPCVVMIAEMGPNVPTYRDRRFRDHCTSKEPENLPICLRAALMIANIP